MNKNFLIVFFLLSFLFSSCSGMFKEQKKTSTLRKPNLSKVINAAVYDVSNVELFTKQSDYDGKIISFVGNVVIEQMLEPKDKVFRLYGSANGNLVDIVVYLDHEMPKQNTFTEDTQLISRGKLVRVFGVLQGMGDYMYESGISKKSPQIRAIVIYNSDDNSFKNPLWIAEAYM